MDTPTREITFSHQGTMMIVTQIKIAAVLNRNNGWTHTAAVKTLARRNGTVEYFANLRIDANGNVVNSKVIK